MKIALYQAPPTDGDVDAAFVRIDATLSAAAAAGARMAVFPELFLPGYNRPDLHASLSQPIGGNWAQKLATLSQQHRCGLCIGWAERDGDAVFNSATCFDFSGKTVGHYRKIQRFGPMEHDSFEPGENYTTFDLDGIKCALLICYDVEFPEHVRALANLGVTLILVPTANPAGFEHVSTALVPARASEMALTIAYANYCGTENGLTFGGHSVICGPDARPLSSAGTTETLLITEITQPYDPGLLSTQRRDYREVCS